MVVWLGLDAIDKLANLSVVPIPTDPSIIVRVFSPGSWVPIPTFPSVVMSHGIAAMAFAISFFLEAYGIHLPLLSIKAQHPSIMLNGFAFIGLLFA